MNERSTQYSTVGTSVRRRDFLEKVTGAAQYARVKVTPVLARRSLLRSRNSAHQAWNLDSSSWPDARISRIRSSSAFTAARVVRMAISSP